MALSSGELELELEPVSANYSELYLYAATRFLKQKGGEVRSLASA